MATNTKAVVPFCSICRKTDAVFVRSRITRRLVCPKCEEKQFAQFRADCLERAKVPFPVADPGLPLTLIEIAQLAQKEA